MSATRVVLMRVISSSLLVVLQRVRSERGLGDDPTRPPRGFAQKITPASSCSIFIVQGGPSAHHHFVGFVGDSRASPCGAPRGGEATPNRSRNASRQTANFPQDPPQDAGS